MGIPTQVLGLLASLAILVLVHELGHFFFARLFKTRVEKFYLFFNPGFSILRMKKIDGKREYSFFSKESPEHWDEYPESTEWGIGWLPLGGYCSIAGMVDETKTADSMGEEPQPWEYRSKPAWQRFFIIIGGVLFNFISALIVYIVIFQSWGETYIPLENAKYGYKFTEVAQNIGFRNGDKIISVDGKMPKDLTEFSLSLLIDNAKVVKVNRHDSIVNISIPKAFGKNVVGEGKGMFATYQFPFVISELVDKMPAKNAGLQVGDSVIALNGITTISYYDYTEAFENNPEKTLKLTVVRGDSTIELAVTPNIDGKVGLSPLEPFKFIETETDYYNIIQSIPKGINFGIEQLGMYVKQFKLVFTKEGASQIGGFGSIGKMFPKSWDWERFWENTALLAIILAFMNILPIPALDGGYILFILIEMITRRKPSDKFIGYANTVGFALLILLLLYANGMDIFRGFFK